MFLGIETDQRAQLIADDAGCAVGFPGILPSEAQIHLGSNHEEAAGLVQALQSDEIEIAPIQDIKSSGFGNKEVEDIRIVQLAVADVDKTWNVAAQVQ